MYLIPNLVETAKGYLQHESKAPERSGRPPAPQHGGLRAATAAPGTIHERCKQLAAAGQQLHGACKV